MHFADFQFGLSLVNLRVYLLFYALVVFVVVNIEIDFVLFEFAFKFEILLSGLGLAAQRIDLLLNFVDKLICRVEIDRSLFEFALRFRSLRAEFGNTCRFFENLTTVARLCRHDFGNSALSYDGITFLADTGVVEKRDDVAHTNAIVIYVIFRKSASVKFSRDNHFVERHRRENMLVGVVERERHFAIRHALTLFRTCENNVLHVFAAQRFRTLFTERPTDSVGNV